MSTRELVVAQNGRGWTIRLSGREFDRFRRKNDAIGTALRWASNAGKQGHQVTVVLQGDGGTTLIPTHWLTPVRAAAHTRRTMRGTLWERSPRAR
jgi:hypothetical protein